MKFDDLALDPEFANDPTLTLAQKQAAQIIYNNWLREDSIRLARRWMEAISIMAHHDPQMNAIKSDDERARVLAIVQDGTKALQEMAAIAAGEYDEYDEYDD